MRFEPRSTAIVGATGPTGRHLLRELVGRDWTVRAVSRRDSALREAFGGLDVEIAAADALDRDALRAAIAGCELVVDCIGLPPDRMADHPRVADNIASAVAAEGARCLMISSYWSFFPHHGEVVDESHPRTGGHQWFRWRREAEDILLDAGALVVHLPDFFGPEVHTSAVQSALEEAVDGKPVSALGDPDTGREVVFVPDAMRVVADLAEHGEAYGTDWALPGNGVLSPRRLAEMAGECLDREVKVRSVQPWMVRPLALFVPALRPVVPLAPHYARAVSYDVSKLRELIGPIELSPLAETIRATLDWIVSQRS